MGVMGVMSVMGDKNTQPTCLTHAICACLMPNPANGFEIQTFSLLSLLLFLTILISPSHCAKFEHFFQSQFFNFNINKLFAHFHPFRLSYLMFFILLQREEEEGFLGADVEKSLVVCPLIGTDASSANELKS